MSLIHTVVFDFDGVFTDNKVYVDQRGRESVRCDRADGLALDLVRYYQHKNLLRAKFFIVTKETNAVVRARAKKMRLECALGVQDKLEYLRSYFARHRKNDANPFKGLIYLGNDINDLAVMEIAGFSYAPMDAHRRVKGQATRVLPCRGGEGFVRAFVDEFLGLSKLPAQRLVRLLTAR
jgi:N-acylneuraminate cytidylyltransferase